MQGLRKWANSHPLGSLGPSQAPVHPSRDEVEILQSQLLTATVKLVQTYHPRKDGHVGDGVAIVNDEIPTLQPLLNHS